MRTCIVILLLFVLLPANAKDGYPRNKNADIIHYDFFVEINDSTDRIEGKAIIEVHFTEASDSISFDLASVDSTGKGMTVTGLLADTLSVMWKHLDSRLVINYPAKTGDTIKYTVLYSGIPSDGLIISHNKFGERVFFSDHWPNRAHCYLPCIDHPYDKATVDFHITAPVKYRIIASGVLESSNSNDSIKTTHWKESVVLPVKVMAFAAAPFAVDTAGMVDGITVTSWVFRGNMEQGFKDYSVAVDPLKYYIARIGEYPFEKLANVQSKTIFGGLENAGNIFYAERSVTGKGRAESLMAHEIAHQWFGNSVTENDWDHVWLSEGFATYLTSMYFESKNGKEALKTDLDSTRARLIRYYRKNKMPVIDTANTDLMKLLNMNSYQKGAWVLHMLRNLVGDEAFYRGLRTYYEHFRNGNVLTDDFASVMEEVSGKELNSFFRQWLYTGGHPQLKIWTKKGFRRKYTINVEQQQERLFEFELELLVKTSSGEALQKVHVTNQLTQFEVQSKTPPRITPDPDVKLLFQLVP
jgi:aminopeptidase N